MLVQTTTHVNFKNILQNKNKTNLQNKLSIFEMNVNVHISRVDFYVKNIMKIF